MTATRRDVKAAAIALVLLVIGVSMSGAGVLWVRHVHHSDLATLYRNPSYRYGERLVDDRKVTDFSVSIRRACQSALVRAAPTFSGYNEPLALEGCVDENNRVYD
jgi:hypothetical protein